MNVFDFDNTIYDGESSFDFFKYCIKKKPSLLKHMPRVAAMLIKYKTGIVDKAEVMEFCSYMLGVLAENKENLKACLDGFWRINEKKLKPVILKLIRPGDVIISASPDFLFDNIRKKLCGAELITTRIDMETMKIDMLCYGDNKVTAFKERYGCIQPENYYTDNINDKPMMQLARRAWLVKGNTATAVRN